MPKNLEDFFIKDENESETQIQTNENYAKYYEKRRNDEEFMKLEQKYKDEDLDAEDSESDEGLDTPDDSDEAIEKFVDHVWMCDHNDPKLFEPGYQYVMGEKKKAKKFEDVPKKEIEAQPIKEEEEIDFSIIEKAIQKWPDKRSDEKIEQKNEKKEKNQKKQKKNENDAFYKLYNSLNIVEKEEDKRFLANFFLNKLDGSGEDPNPDDVPLDEDIEALNEQERHEQKYNFRFEDPDPEVIKRYPRKIEGTLAQSESKRKRQREAKKQRKQELEVKRREELKRTMAAKRKELAEIGIDVRAGVPKSNDEEETLEKPNKKRRTGCEENDLEDGEAPTTDNICKKETPLVKEERIKELEDQRKEEIKKLKELRRKNTSNKLEKIKYLAGKDDLNIDDVDLEEDFDPEKHDKMMQEMFNEDYYKNEDEVEKPDLALDDEDDFENWDEWPGRGEKEDLVDESSEEVLPSTSQGISENKNAEKKSKKHKRSQFYESLKKDKPVFDPASGKSYEDYLNEYYNLAYEDIIGNMPVRFKYRKVIPNDFGLSTDEILAAQEWELNKWCSLKKVVQLRTEDEELYDIKAYKKKAELPGKKEKILSSVYTGDEETLQAAADAYRKKKRKHKRQSGKKN